MSYVELEDGTRVYENGHRYKPVSPEKRKRAVRKPDDPRAVRWRGEWLLPLELLDEAARTMPPTRPDMDAKGHVRGCR
jgi:hypothetical protein